MARAKRVPKKDKKVSKKLSPESYFLRYAYPCSFMLVDLGKITNKKRQELEKRLLLGQPVPRQELEKIFAAAFKRLRQIASEMKKDCWDLDVIKEYFFGERHNDFIDRLDGIYAELGPSLRELCKVHKAQVIDKRGNVITVKYDGVARNVFSTLVPDAKPGDRVTVHWAFAIEKIS